MKYLAGLIISLFLQGQVFAAITSTPLISLTFEGSMSDIERQTFIDAADYYNSVITGYDLVSDEQGNATPHSLNITAVIEPIDGQSGTLGSAGPTQTAYYDDNPFGPPTLFLFYSSEGRMRFDSADTGLLVANNTFYAVVLHEMAHVLGFGNLWEANTNPGYNLYTTGSGEYYGANGLAKWQAEFNRPTDTFVPVELSGGLGTADGHWNESDDDGFTPTGFISEDTGLDFANELMTGWASNVFYVSTATLGAIDDLGYIVDYSKAGIIDHVVVVPEVSTTSLLFLSAACVFRRSRKSVRA